MMWNRGDTRGQKREDWVKQTEGRDNNTATVKRHNLHGNTNNLVWHIQPLVNGKCPVCFRTLQEARAHKNPTNHRQTEQT